MSYFEQIKADMYSSMKSGDKEKTATLRTVLSILKAKQLLDKQMPEWAIISNKIIRLRYYESI